MATSVERSNRSVPDYTDRSYWNGIIKMSLSKFFVLCVLQEQSLHGYAIVRAVEQTTRGCCSPAEGTIYPVLRDFEQGGYVTVHNEIVDGRKRKVYTITNRGREAFRVAVAAWMEVTNCLVENGASVAAPGSTAGCCSS